MALNIVELPYSYFPDFSRGRPLFNADIYVGNVDTDPEIPANQKQITVRQEDGTEVQIAQPVKTSAGGVPTYNGSPVTVLVEGTYSIKVLDRLGAEEYYSPDVTKGVPLTPELLPAYTDLVFDSIDEMLTGTPKITWSSETIGAKATVNGTEWKQVSFSTPMTIADFENSDRKYIDDLFGKSGTKLVIGEDLAFHYGFGGNVITDTGKILYVYRKAVYHGINNDAEVWVAESTDFGQTIVNHRKLADNTGVSDVRPQKPRVFSNGRIGFICNRIAENGDDFDPILLYSDNDGDAFTTTTLVRPVGSEAYSFDAHGGFIEYPTSQGGSDDGYIGFGFIANDSGGIGALFTVDNWNTYGWITDSVAFPGGDTTQLSETSYVNIGGGRWLCYGRNRDASGWRQEAACWKVTDLQNWGPILPSGATLGGNPPHLVFNPSTNKVTLFSPARVDRNNFGNTFENWLMKYEADADDLWNANGDFSALGVTFEPVMPMPNWGTFYGDTSFYDNFFYFTYTCAETDSAGTLTNGGCVIAVGDFTGSQREQTVVNSLYNRRQIGNSISLIGRTNSNSEKTFQMENASRTNNFQMNSYRMDVTTGGAGYAFAFDKLTIENRTTFGTLAPTEELGYVNVPVASSSIPAYLSSTATSSSRVHCTYRNANGQVGSITTSGSNTAFNTTSDETLKDFTGEMDAQKAIDIIKADPVREWNWKATGEHACGWGAQTSYSVSKDLATKGGWFLDDEEVTEDTEGAVYIPWGVDQSKRTPYLWAALSALIDKVAALEEEVNLLKNK